MDCLARANGDLKADFKMLLAPGLGHIEQIARRADLVTSSGFVRQARSGRLRVRPEREALRRSAVARGNNSLPTRRLAMLTNAIQKLIQRFVRLASRRLLAHAACGAILALTLIAAPRPAAGGGGEVVHAEMDDEGGILVVFYSADEDLYWYTYFSANGDSESEEIGNINPNPEDGTTTPGDWDSRLALLKQHGGNGMSGPALEETPLGMHLAGKGKGIGPLHNPSNEDAPGGQSPSNSSWWSDKDAFEQMMEGAGYPHGPGFDGNGGPMGGQIRDALKRGKKGGGGDSGMKRSDGGFWDENMPGPPELVNPATRKKSFTLMAPLTGSGLGGSSKGIQTNLAAGHSVIGNLNPGSSIRSKQVSGGALSLGTNNGLTSGARAMTGLKLTK
jgi:hypothetical protein